MGDADVALLPSVPVPVPSIEEATTGSPADVAAKIALVTHCNRGINYLGLPAISVPCGFVDGLPTAFQLVARPFDEAILLRAADAFQRVTTFHRQRPPAC
jgi:aspartyl-tRNA(Asn)/glutamyl-tRNA(Gln) amidotransferase subunit A